MRTKNPEIFKKFVEENKNKKVKNSIIFQLFEENGKSMDEMITKVNKKIEEIKLFGLFIRTQQKEIVLESDFRSFIEHCLFKNTDLFNPCSKTLSIGLELLIEDKSP